jgi:hypothetical protein
VGRMGVSAPRLEATLCILFIGLVQLCLLASE